MKNTYLILIAFSIFIFSLICCDNGSSGSAEIDTFSISYNSNGAEFGKAPAGQKGDIKTAQAIQANVGNLAKNGYVFECWNTAKDGSGTNYTPGTSYKTGKNLVLYAKWVRLFNYSVENQQAAQALNGTQKAPGLSYARITGLTEKGRQFSDINIPDTIDGYRIASIGNNAFQGCDNVASITIPATVTTIGANAFSGCSSIEAITIPASVTSIGSGAFSSCASLTSLVMLSTTPPAMGDNVLADTTATVSVPASGVTAYMSAEGWNTYSSSISGYSTEVLTVTFDPQGGTIVATSATIKVEPPAVTVGQLPPDPVYQGYKFGGWNTQADGQGTDFTASTVVTANMTVYAQWISHRYTVTFDGQGSDSEPDPASVIVESPNTTVSAFPAGLSRHGFFFGGWFTEENGKGTEFTTSTTVNDNITVYAYWTEHPEYKVTFNGQDATTEADPACISVKSPATTVGTLPTAPSRTGYIFGGWFTQPNGGGYAFTENTEVTDNITVFAKWNEYKYTVSFDKQGGDTEANPASIDVKSPDTTVKTLPASPTKEGCYFSGWFTKTNGEGTAFTENTVVTDNITVYAYWTAKPVYTVTFDSQGAETHADPESITLENSATTVGTLPTQPIKKGYDFGGWFTEVNGGGSEFLANTTVTASLTVFAKWTAQTYAIIYKDKGGSDFSGTHGSNHPTSHTYGTATTLVNPTKADYDFGGWYTTSDCTGDAVTTLGATAFTQNITLYAKWIQKQAPVATYTVTFNSQNADTDAYPPSIEVTSPAATTVGVLPSEPVKEGYIFDSWNTRADGTGTAFTASTMVTGNITVYALWKENGLVYCKYETVGSDLVVTGLTRAGEDQSTIIIPSMINGKNVTKIGREAFEEENELTQIILPDGLISIEERAFHECDNLTSIILPDSLTTIGAEAFLECSKLSNITIPQNVTSIGEGAFGVCDVLNITVGNGNQSYCIVNGILFNKNKTKLFFCPRNIIGSYSIPNGVVSIGDYAFEGCKGLSDITIPDSVTSIGYYAFEDCSGLKNITIPKNVTSIGEYAFSLSGEGFSIIINATTPPAPLDIYNPYFISNDFALLSIIVPSASIDTYKSAAGWSEYVDKIVGDGYTYKVTFDSCNSDTPASPASIEVTSPATTVGTLPSEPVKEGYIFDGWNTKSDGTGTAFSADTTVSGDITVYAVWIGVNELFVYNIKNSVVTITGLTSLGKSQTELVIPDKIEGYPVTGIGVGAQTSTDGAFYNCTNLVSVTIPSGVTTIGGAAFYGCTGLTRVSIPDSVTVIDWRAFQRCTNLTDITIPDGVTTIGYYAFSDCTKLSSMTIPASVTSVGKGAFYCDFSVVDGNTNYSCSDGILFNKNKTKLVSCPLGKKGNYVIPNTVTIVGEDAFTECAGLTSITIPENVVSIGNYAFYKCTGLTTVNYNAVNCTLSDEAYAPFYGCSSLTTLNIGNNVETIPGYLFYSCSKLTNITFGNSLHSIGESAFEGCTGLISVSLPDSLTEIGEDAFYECTKLSSITIPDNVIKVASGAFKKCTSLTTVNFNAIYCTVMGDDDKGCFDGCKKITKINIGNKVTIIPNDASPPRQPPTPLAFF